MLLWCIPNVTQNVVFSRRESPAVERSQLAPYCVILNELRSLNPGTLTMRKNHVLSYVGYILFADLRGL